MTRPHSSPESPHGAPVVEITSSGRGGSIRYREGDHTIVFDWEFAGGNALALVWGPQKAHWDAACPWARGRQESIYDFVGAEVVRQKASGGSFEYDVERGEMTIYGSDRGR